MSKHAAAQRGWQYRHSSLVFCVPPLCVCHNLLINPEWSCWWYQRWWTLLLFLHPHLDRSLFISLCSDHGGGKSKRENRQLVDGHVRPTLTWPMARAETIMQYDGVVHCWYMLFHFSRPISVPNDGYIGCQGLYFINLFCLMALHSPQYIIFLKKGKWVRCLNVEFEPTIPANKCKLCHL